MSTVLVMHPATKRIVDATDDQIVTHPRIPQDTIYGIEEEDLDTFLDGLNHPAFAVNPRQFGSPTD